VIPRSLAPQGADGPLRRTVSVMKLFQIEEPDGSPLEAEGTGAAIGIELSAAKGAAVAAAIGGNAEILRGAGGAERFPVVALGDDAAALGPLLRALRERAEKALARPVTHAVVALEPPLYAGREAALASAAAEAGLILLRLIESDAAAILAPGAAAADAAALGAAIQAEDDASRLAPR
jgi:hypothetical protein